MPFGKFLSISAGWRSLHDKYFSELLKVIKNGVIHDCPLTSTDVMNWNRINGIK